MRIIEKWCVAVMHWTPSGEFLLQILIPMDLSLTRNLEAPRIVGLHNLGHFWIQTVYRHFKVLYPTRILTKLKTFKARITKFFFFCWKDSILTSLSEYFTSFYGRIWVNVDTINLVSWKLKAPPLVLRRYSLYTVKMSGLWQDPSYV